MCLLNSFRAGSHCERLGGTLSGAALSDEARNHISKKIISRDIEHQSQKLKDEFKRLFLLIPRQGCAIIFIKLA